jgi:hypothetical protein
LANYLKERVQNSGSTRIVVLFYLMIEKLVETLFGRLGVKYLVAYILEEFW